MSCLKATDNYQDIIKSSLRDIASSGGLQQVQPLCKSQVRVSASHYLPHEMTTVHLGTQWTHSGEVITHSAGEGRRSHKFPVRNLGLTSSIVHCDDVRQTRNREGSTSLA